MIVDNNKIIKIDTSELLEAALRYNQEVEKIFEEIKILIETTAKSALNEIDDILSRCSNDQKSVVVGNNDIPRIDLDNFKEYLIKIVNNGISWEILPTMSGSLSDHILLSYYGLDYKLNKLRDCIAMIERINIDCIKHFH